MTIDLTGHLKTCRRSHPHEEMDDVCERYTEYERQLASLRAEKDALRTAIEQARMVNGLLTQRAEKAEAERDAAVKDAERWKWSRYNGVLKRGKPMDTYFIYNDEADAYADAAVSARKGKQ